MRILVIDNYDSFTFNLLHLISEVCDSDSSTDITANDKITAPIALTYDCVIISPGPGVPQEAGNLMNIIKSLAPVKPMLGVCLGHQAIAQTFGAELYCTAEPLHGVKTEVSVTERTGIFKDMPEVIEVGRYHSWGVSNAALPDCLKITAKDRSGNIMAISHAEYNVHGVQFHPESFLTPQGGFIIKNFLDLSR